MAKRLAGFQIVDLRDNPPKGQNTYEIYPLRWCLKWIVDNRIVDGREVFWRLIPIFEGEVEEPQFPKGRSSLEIEV